MLMGTSEFDEAEQLWYWKYEDNELFYDIDEPIRVQVESYQILFEGEEKKIKIYCSCNKDGLGLIS